MGAGAGDFGLGRRGRLQDQDGFGQGEDAEGLQERVRAEERDEGILTEDAGPDVGDEEYGAALGEPAGAWGRWVSQLKGWSSCWGGWGGFQEGA